MKARGDLKCKHSMCYHSRLKNNLSLYLLTKLVTTLLSEKKYYIQTLIDELGDFNDTANKTYAYDNTTVDIIVKLHLEKMTQLRVEVSEKQQDLPKLY